MSTASEFGHTPVLFIVTLAFVSQVESSMRMLVGSVSKSVILNRNTDGVKIMSCVLADDGRLASAPSAVLMSVSPVCLISMQRRRSLYVA